MEDILMVAEPERHAYKLGPHTTLFLTAEQFFTDEKLLKAHDTVLWQSFNTHSKYARIVRHAEYFTVAVDTRGRYLGSAFVVPIGQKWLIEYVMTDPTKQQRGVGTSVMARLMKEAKKRKISWCILNCNPQALDGQLPAFYKKFGFEEQKPLTEKKR